MKSLRSSGRNVNSVRPTTHAAGARSGYPFAGEDLSSRWALGMRQCSAAGRASHPIGGASQRPREPRPERSRLCRARAALRFCAMPHARAPKVCVFPGQFDPITNGHIDVIRRGVTLFDELIVAVGINPEKRELFTLKERVEMIRSLLKTDHAVRVEQYTGLTVDFVRQSKATAILRG